MKRSDIWWAAAYGLLAVFTVLFCVTGGFAKVNTAYPYLYTGERIPGSVCYYP